MSNNDPFASLFSALAVEPIDPFTSARLVRRVMAATDAARVEAAAGRPAVGWGWARLAVAAALFLTVGLIVRYGLLPPAPSGEVQIVDVKVNGGVHLSWADAGRKRYEVLKSADAGDFSSARRKIVRGTHYVDSDPDPGQVVFYRVQ